MSDRGEIIFGGLTQGEVVEGLQAEAAHIRAIRCLELHESAQPGSDEASIALSGFFRAQHEGSLQAHLKLALARLEESAIPEATATA